jgi:N utilization substance protein B
MTQFNKFNSESAPVSIHQKSEARRLALQALFQADAQGDDFFTAGLADFMAQSTNDISVRLLAIRMANHAWEYRKISDDWITRLMTQWSLPRVAAVDRSILWLGLWELTAGTDTPPKVVLDEAVNMAKEFSTADSSKFINGILGAAYNQHMANLADARPQKIPE